MKHFAIYDDSGRLITFGSTSASKPVGEITPEEYDALMAAHIVQCEYARQICDGLIAMDDVPEEHRDRVSMIAESLQAQPEPADPAVEEALAILRGEVTQDVY